jgi:hypothetical protein
MNPLRQKTVLTDAPWRQSQKMKIDVEHALAMPTWRGGSISAIDFEKSKWDIMYPLFVEEGLVGPFECVNRKDT